jgi:hypothetical protein
MLTIFAESLFIASRGAASLRQPNPPMLAAQGWLARILSGRG